MAILTKEMLWKTLVEGIILALVVWGTQFYFQKRYAPDIAAETLKKENFLNAKRDAYFEAINIANKVIANSDYDSIDMNGNIIPSKFLHKHHTDLSEFEIEINNAYCKLLVFAPDTVILSSYFKIFVSPPNQPHIPILAMKDFLINIRNDLNSDKELPANYKLPYIAMPSKVSQ